MEGLIALVVVVVAVTLAGPFMLILGLRKLKRLHDKARVDRQLPLARIDDGSLRLPKKGVLSALFQTIVGALLSVGLGLVIWIINDIATNGILGKSNSKGRLLRIREHAHLPPAARGRGWTDSTLPDLAGVGAWERAVLGQAWLVSARMEHASVAAFAQLSLHLAALGAPPVLLARTHAAALDEIRHTQRCFALASAYSGQAWTAGAITALAKTPAPAAAMTFARLACGSLIDGCLAEGLAADVAAAGAANAADPVVRATFEMIAADETRHAELAWDVLVWCLDADGATTRCAVEARLERLDDELTPRLPDIPGLSRHRLRQRGLLHQDDLGVLAEARLQRTKDRARDLIGVSR